MDEPTRIFQVTLYTRRDAVETMNVAAPNDAAARTRAVQRWCDGLNQALVHLRAANPNGEMYTPEKYSDADIQYCEVKLLAESD